MHDVNLRGYPTFAVACRAGSPGLASRSDKLDSNGVSDGEIWYSFIPVSNATDSRTVVMLSTKDDDSFV
jgi:hypothetical protein